MRTACGQTGYLGTPIYSPRSGGAMAEMPGARGPQPSRPLRRILNGGTEIEYLGDICAGDVLTSRTYVSKLDERKGSIGDMLIQETKTEYTNQDGKLVAVSTGTLIRY